MRVSIWTQVSSFSKHIRIKHEITRELPHLPRKPHAPVTNGAISSLAGACTLKKQLFPPHPPQSTENIRRYQRFALPLRCRMGKDRFKPAFSQTHAHECFICWELLVQHGRNNRLQNTLPPAGLHASNCAAHIRRHHDWWPPRSVKVKQW